MHTTHSQPTMVRETRHLWVGNLPENIREDKIIDHFKRYGKVQSVRILPNSSSESNGTGLGSNNSLNGTMLCNGVSATVAFIDIKSAAKAHSCEHKIEERTLKTDYYEPQARSYDESPHPSAAKSASSSLTSSSSSSTSSAVSSTVAAVAASSSTIAAASSSTSSAAPPSAASSGTSQPSVSSTSASSSSSVPSAAASSSSASSSTSPATSLPSNAALYGRHTPSRISGEERYESRERNCANNLDSRDSTNYLLKSRNISSYHDDESPSYSSRNRSSRESSVSSRASFVGNATSSSSGNRNVSSSTGINSYPDVESHGSNSTTAHEPLANASSHHGTSSAPYQNLPGASSTQDNLSSSTSSSHSNDREEVKPTSSICVRNFPTRSTESNLKEGLYHEFKRYGRIIGMRFHDTGANRHAVVNFKKVEDAERALNDSKDKQFFGNRIEVSFIEPEVEESDSPAVTTVTTPTSNSVDLSGSKSEIDEYHPRATRTLFVGNLDKDITKSDLTNKFSQFGEILEIDIKSQCHQPYAFIQFTDISSVVNAMRKYDGEPMGGTRLKCGFGKSFPNSCVWLCDTSDAKERAFVDSEKILAHLGRYGSIKNHVIGRDKKGALIYFESSDEARKVVDELHNKSAFFNGRKVQVDYASRDFQNYFITKFTDAHGPSSSRGSRSSTSGWMSNSMNSLDYEERPYESSRSNRSSMYHHHQTTSRSSSSSMSSSQLMRSNSGTSSSYSARQRSQSPSSSPAPLSNFGRFSSSSTSLKNSKYDYHHESSSSRMSSRPYRYESNDIDDMGEDSHLSSSSKRESSSSSRYRSHHMSDNYLSENSPKVRRDSSPYGLLYGSSSIKSDAEFGSSNSRSSRPTSNLDDLKGHDDSHSSSLRRVNSHKSYHKSSSGRDSPPLPLSHSTSQSFRKSGLTSSNSSTSSNSRSPVRDSKSNSYYLERTSSISPPAASPRNSGGAGHSSAFHDGDSQNDLSAHGSANKLDKDYNSQSSWRRKSTEDSSYYRDYASGDAARSRTESISESNDSAFLSSNSTREHGRDYYRSRDSSLHRTNSSPSASLTYQNRSDALKRKHSTLESDEDSTPGTVQERKKRLMAAIEPGSVSLNSSSSSLNATVLNNNNNQAPLSAPPTTPVKSSSSSSLDQRLASSKSLDAVDGVNGSRQPPSKPLRDAFPPLSSDILKRRSSSSSSSSSMMHNSLSSGGNGSSSAMLDLKSKSDLKELLNNMHIPFQAEEEANPQSVHMATTLFYNLISNPSMLYDGKAVSTSTPAPAAGARKSSLSGSSAATLPSSSNGGGSCVSIATASAGKPKTTVVKENASEAPPKTIDVSCSLVSGLPDPRTSGHSSRKLTTSRTSCDNDLSKHKAFDPLSSSSLASSSSASLHRPNDYGPANPMILRVPEFLLEFWATPLDKRPIYSRVIESSCTVSTPLLAAITTTTTTASTLTPIVTATLPFINIPTFTTTSSSPKSSNTIMSPLGSHSPVPKSRLSRDRLSTDTNSIDSKKPNDLDDVSDISDKSPLRTSSLDDQIKALDEKYNAWSGTTASMPTSFKTEKTPTIDYSKYNIKKKSQSSTGNTSTAQLGNSTESEPSDFIKNILARSSVFDQDTKRLEHINEKYEPRKDLDLENILSSSKSKVVNTFLRTKSLSSSGSIKEPSASALPALNSVSHSSSGTATGPTDKTTNHESSLSSLPKASPTTTAVASSHHNSNAMSTSHFNHQHHHHPFSSSSSASNAIPSLSSSIPRKLSDPSRVSSLKKDSSLGSTSAPTPGTPSSAPVRSTSSSMFPQFHRSSSIPTTTHPPSTPTTTSSLARSAFPPHKKENLFAGGSGVSSSSSSGNSISTLPPSGSRPDKSKVDLGYSKSSSLSINRPDSDRKDLAITNHRKDSLTSSTCITAKPDTTTVVRKDSLTKQQHSAPKVDYFNKNNNNKSDSLFKSSEIPASRKEHKHSGESDHSSNHIDHETSREKLSDYLKHFNKERDEHRKCEKDASAQHKSDKNKDKSSDGGGGHLAMSNHNNHGSLKESKEKMERKMEKNLLKEKEKKKKEKMRDKESLSSGSKEKEKEKDKEALARHKAKMLERSEKRDKMETKDKSKSNKEKDKGSEKRKEKHKGKRAREQVLTQEEINALLSIPDTDSTEPMYFSMYDKVKARSQNNQKNHTVNSLDSGIRSKLSQLAHKRHGHRKDDNSSDDSASDSDADEPVQRPKKKLMKQKRKVPFSDESSEDEEVAPKRVKKANVDETDSETETAKTLQKDKYAKKLLDFTDDSSENEEKKAAGAGSAAKKKNKKLKKDKERPNDIGSPVKEKVERHEAHEKMKDKEREKEKEHLKSKKNKAERKEKERDSEKESKREAKVPQLGAVKAEKEKEKEKRLKSDGEEQSSANKLARMAKRKKKKAKDKSFSKEKQRLLGTSKEDGKLHPEQNRRTELSSDEDMLSDLSDVESMSLGNVPANTHNATAAHSDSDHEPRTHVIKCWSKEQKQEIKQEPHHYHNDKDKQHKDKANNLLERNFASATKVEKGAAVAGDRSPTKKNSAFSFNAAADVKNNNNKDQKVVIKSEDENENSCKELTVKKKKKFGKSKDKPRKDSESSDSKKSDRKDSKELRALPDLSSADSDDILSISPTRVVATQPKTDFKSLILPEMTASIKESSVPSPPPKTPEVSSSRSSSYTEDLGLVHQDRDDGSSSDSRLDEELMNDARKLEECMMAKNDDSYDSNLSGSNSPLNSTSKTLHQTDLTNLLPTLMTQQPAFASECDTKTLPSFFTPPQRCYDEEAQIQSYKLQKELESKDSEHHIKPSAFESLPFPRFPGTVEKPIVEEPVFSETAAKVPEDPTLFITSEIESTSKIPAVPAPIDDAVKCPDFSEMESQRNIEDDLAVAALLQDMNDPIHVPGTHDRTSIDQAHPEEMSSFLNILGPRTSSSDGDRPETLLTTPSAQAIVVTSPVVPPIIAAPEISIDDHELNAAVHEIELPCTSVDHKEQPPAKPVAEVMFNDEDDDEPALIVDESVLDKSLRDDSAPRLLPGTKKPAIAPIGGLAPFGGVKPFSFEPSICLPKSSSASLDDIVKASIKEIASSKMIESAKVKDPNKTGEEAATALATTPKPAEPRTIDLHMSMPILTSAFDTKIQTETVPIKERTRSTDSDRSEPIKSPFASFLSPRSVHSDTAPTEKKGLPNDYIPTFAEAFLALHDEKRDSCSESVVSDKTEIEEESASELLFNENCKLSSGDSFAAVSTTNDDHLPSSIEAKGGILTKLSEESEPECETLPPKPKRGRKPKNRKSSDSSLHSPRSDLGLEQHGPMTSLCINTNLTSSGSLLLSPTSNSNTSSTTTASDISPGSQGKRGSKQQQQQQQQQSFSYNIRRSARSAAVAATVANSNTALELDENDFSTDEPLYNNKDDAAEEEQGVKKSKRGRKKKNLQSNTALEHLVKLADEDKSKKERHAPFNTEHRSSKSANNLYDVFEFRESDEEDPMLEPAKKTTLSLGSSHFMSSTAEEKRHPEQQQQQQPPTESAAASCVSPPKPEVPTPAITLPNSEASSAASGANATTFNMGVSIAAATSTAAVTTTGKEYVSEMNQHGKHGGISMIIRLQQKDGQDGFTGALDSVATATTTKGGKNLATEDSKSNDGMSNSSEGGTNSNIKGVRKSARLMSQVPKTTIEDTIEDVIVKTKDDKANASKRITRSYRKSDDTNSAHTGELSEDGADDPKTGSRPYRVTRSRGAVHTDSDMSSEATTQQQQQQPRTPVAQASVTSPPPPRTPKKSTDSMEQTEIVLPPLVQSTMKAVEMPPVAKPTVPHEQQQPQQVEQQQALNQQPAEESNNTSAPVTSPKSTVPVTSTAEGAKAVEPPQSVIHSTGNVDKIPAIPSVGTSIVAANSVITSMAALCSTSAATSSASVITTAATTPSFITSPTYLQDIPNISERIHHSSTALKLKTGKGLYFDPSLESPSVVSITPVTPSSVITPPASTVVSPKMTEAPVAMASSTASITTTTTTIMPTAAISGSQSITIKPKTQPPVGPSMSQLPASEMWSTASASAAKTYISPATTPAATSVPSTIAPTHHNAPSTFAESEPTSLVQPPPAHILKLPLSVATTIAMANDSSKGINLASQSMPTSVVTSHQSPAMVEMTGKAASSVPANAMHPANKTASGSSSSKPSAVPVPGVPPPMSLGPQELAAQLGAFPQHLVPNHPHAAHIAEYQQYLSNLQKQHQQQQQQSQLHSSQQTAANNRTAKSTDPASGFVSPSGAHLSTAELQQAAAAGILHPQFAGLPAHLRPPVSSASGQPMHMPRPGFGMPGELELAALAQQLQFYSQLQPDLRNAPNALPRPPLPRYMFPSGLTFGGHFTPEAYAEMAKDQAKQMQQQQQQNAAKKEDNHHHRAPTAEELKQHHLGEPPFHLDPSTGMPPPGRSLPFPGNMRPFHYPLPQPERFGVPDAALLQSMYGINGQGRGMPISPHNFAGNATAGPSNPTDLSKPGSNQSSTTTAADSLKRSSAAAGKQQATQDAAYLSQMHRQMPSPNAHSPAFRKDMPTVQEPTAEMIRSHMAAGMVPPAASPLMNMSASQMNQRPPSRPPSTLVQSTHPLSRPSSIESSIGEQPSPMANRPQQQQQPPQPSPASIHNLGIVPPSAVGSEPHAAHAISTPIVPPVHREPSPNAPQPGSTAPSSQDILQKYPILWNGLLALKNDQVSVQMHFVNGNRDISHRALPSFNEVNMPLRITQRMRIEPSQLTALDRKIQSNGEFCILLALPCGRDGTDVLLQSENLKRFFINYLKSKDAAGIVNTTDDSNNYITHIFPTCDFSENHLTNIAPDLLHSLGDISHLMVVITSNPPNTTNVY